MVVLVHNCYSGGDSKWLQILLLNELSRSERIISLWQFGGELCSYTSPANLITILLKNWAPQLFSPCVIAIFMGLECSMIKDIGIPEILVKFPDLKELFLYDNLEQSYLYFCHQLIFYRPCIAFECARSEFDFFFQVWI